MALDTQGQALLHGGMPQMQGARD